MKIKKPKACCGYCTHFRYISKCSENEVTAFETNPLGQCTLQKRSSLVLKAYKSAPCESYKGMVSGSDPYREE